MSIEIGMLGFVAIVLMAVLWHGRTTARAVASLEERLARQADALSLLTETSESGFTSVARELERVAIVTAKPARKPAARRLTTAARKGRTVGEIAAAEGISEGEVRLRLHLAGHDPSGEPARG